MFRRGGVRLRTCAVDRVDVDAAMKVSFEGGVDVCARLRSGVVDRTGVALTCPPKTCWCAGGTQAELPACCCKRCDAGSITGCDEDCIMDFNTLVKRLWAVRPPLLPAEAVVEA